MPRLDRLTSIRGVAALYVILFHCQGRVGGFDLSPWTGLLEKGYLAVDFFFVLSGFILAYVYAPEFDAGRGRFLQFLGFRLARIYPVHLLTLALAVAVVTWFFGFGHAGGMSNTGTTLLSNILLAHAWGIHEQLSWNFPSWSISAEWFAYLAFPWLLAISRVTAQRAWESLLGAVLCLISLAAVVALVRQPGLRIGSWLFVSHAQWTRAFDLTFDLALVRVGCEFLAGLFVFRAYQLISKRRCDWSAPVAIVSLVSLVICLHVPWPRFRLGQDLLAVTLMTITILCVALDRHRLAEVLEYRPLVYLGEASYSIYMAHGVVLWLFYGLTESGMLAEGQNLREGTVLAAAVITATLATGALLYEVCEQPARRKLRAALGA